MNKLEIFDEIVNIMKKDASCCKDEKGADPEQYRLKITETMHDDEFLYLVKSYLATFHVEAHVSFYNEKRGKLSFRVKRYNNALYVYDHAKNSPLSIGDKIIEIDGLSIDEYALKHEEMLYGTSEERQVNSWYHLLSFAKEIKVRKNNSNDVEVVPIVLNGEWDDAERYLCKKLRDNTVMIKLADFNDEEKIQKLYADNDELIRNCSNLIIDVRHNGGGYSTSFLPLLEFILPVGAKINDLKDDVFDSKYETNYTERNCDSRIQLFKDIIQADLPVETKQIVEQMIKVHEELKGKGFVIDDTEDSLDIPYVGQVLPTKVFVITDEDCGSSGDGFVDFARKSSKVTVVGRPTMGIQDFTDCTEIKYGDFGFMYPTKRALYLDDGIQMRNNGVPVDVYVEWTPESLVKDVELEKIFEMIDNQ